MKPTEQEVKERQSIAENKLKYTLDLINKAETRLADIELEISDDKQLLEEAKNNRLKIEKENLLLQNTEKGNLASLQKELRLLKGNIADRKKYLKEQEANIDTAVHNFNNRLRELQSDIKVIDNEKDTNLRELADLQEQIRTTKEELNKVSENLIGVQAFYDETVANIKIEIRELQAEKQRADLNLKHSQDEASKLIKKLAEKEKELSVREQILDEREAIQATEAEYLRKKHALIQRP